MAGHSKFKNIQFRKGAQDKKRSKIFSKLSRDITLAAKQGLPDPTANARLRLEGTANLIAAALAAGARRLIAQSICFTYAPGPEPHVETDPLLPGEASASARGPITMPFPPDPSAGFQTS